MSKISYITDYIARRHAIHTKKLRKNLPGLGEVFEQRAEEFLTRYEGLLAGEGRTLDFAIDCYLKMLADVAAEGVRFQESGKYSSTSFREVNERVYGNPEVMAYYMHGLLMSQFLWKHHYEMFCFFIEELTKRAATVKNYLEIGGGHGLQVSQATKILGPDAKFTVVDISPISLGIAQRLVANEKVHFILQDVFQYHPEKKFDFITMGEVLEHVEDPVALLKALFSLLADDGTLFITTPTNAPAIDHLYLFRNADEIRAVLAAAGFKITAEFQRYAEDVSPEVAEKYQISLLYGACLEKIKEHDTHQ